MDSLKFTHRLIVLDTETTGLSYQDGHRIIEIGAIELLNRRFTGKRFHAYINPERFIDEGALAVHGISNEFLADKALFKEISGDFIDFIEGAELIIHNAPFDVGFINYEFSLLENFNKTIADYCTVFDTLKFAKQKHQGQRNSLDALCKRYGVDNSQRELHGALLDAEILADVLKLKIEEVGVEVVKKDNLQSARLAGFGNTDLAVELFVDERYYGKISPVLEEFRMSL